MGDELDTLVDQAIAADKAQSHGGDATLPPAMALLKHGLSSLRRIAVALEAANVN